MKATGTSLNVNNTKVGSSSISAKAREKNNSALRKRNCALGPLFTGVVMDHVTVECRSAEGKDGR